jgi:hypothetical protein
MSDSLSLTFTKDDGTVVSVTGNIVGGSLVVTPPVVVAPPPPPPPPPVNIGEPVIPASAVTIDMLPIKTWAVNQDAGTPGDANGTTTYPVTAPDGTANCRQFQFTLINKGGVIYHSNVMKDSSAVDTFCMETEEFYPDPSNLACIERDMEQADATGAYVDMATQLNGHAGFLDYTSSNPKGWQHTKVKANPMGIPKGTWYTTKRYFQNLGGGMVKYIGSNDNGTYSHLDITTKSQPGAKWGKNVLNFQYQFDGSSAGSVQSTVYARKMLIHAWKS